MNRFNFPNHYIFRYYNGGYNVTLKGKINVLFIFSNEPNSSWNETSQKEFLKAAKEGLNNLERLSKAYNVDLIFKPSKVIKDLKFNVNININDAGSITLDESIIITNNMNLKQYYLYNKSKGYDDTIFIFAVNRVCDGVASVYPNEIKDEVEAILIGRDSFTNNFISISIVHELLHLYGAMDYYSPSITKKYAEIYFPDSIMNETIIRNNNYIKAKIDPLTAYLIGWRDTLTKSSIDFLNNTLDVKLEDIYND